MATTAVLAIAPAVFGIATAHAAGLTEVTSCGTIITSPGSYELAADLGPCPGDGIDIETSGVTLDLLNHTIKGPGAASTFAGIAVPGAATTSVTITSSTGGASVTAFGVGIDVSGTSTWGVVVSNLSASRDGDGIDIINAPKVPQVANVTASSEVGTGILVSVATGATITNSTADSDQTGIDVETSLGTIVTGNTVQGNSYGIVNSPATVGVAVTAGEATIALDNVATRSSILDINEEAAGCIADIWLANTFATASQTCVH
jgi:parallel beta-helix repeat protein